MAAFRVEPSRLIRVRPTTENIPTQPTAWRGRSALTTTSESCRLMAYPTFGRTLGVQHLPMLPSLRRLPFGTSCLITDAACSTFPLISSLTFRRRRERLILRQIVIHKPVLIAETAFFQQARYDPLERPALFGTSLPLSPSIVIPCLYTYRRTSPEIELEKAILWPIKYVVVPPRASTNLAVIASVFGRP